MEVNQTLIDQVAELVESYPDKAEAPVVLRGLYRLYFDNKPAVNIQEKQFLLAEGFRFSVVSGVPYKVDREVFKEESDRHYQHIAEKE